MAILGPCHQARLHLFPLSLAWHCNLDHVDKCTEVNRVLQGHLQGIVWRTRELSGTWPRCGQSCLMVRTFGLAKPGIQSRARVKSHGHGTLGNSSAEGQSRGSEGKYQSQWVSWRCGQEAELRIRAGRIKDGDGQELSSLALPSPISQSNSPSQGQLCTVWC